MFSKIKAISVAFATAMTTTLAVFAGPTTAIAGDVPQAVKTACRSDFIRHCIVHEPGTSSARDCMAGVFHKLSPRCSSAILSSNLVNDSSKAAKPKEQVAKTTKTSKPNAKTKSARASKTKTKTKNKTKTIRSAKRHKPTVRKSKQRTARSKLRSRSKKVTRYINRGTKIANRYIARAFKKAFR
ncbi:MAG: hypothetical protein AAFO75_04865 [Pseudomonadota bacterium]